MDDQIKALKKEDGSMLQMHGSSVLIRILLKNDFVDELWLKIYPATRSNGKRMFAEGTIPAAFELTESKALPGGVIVTTYRRPGNVKAGSFA